MKIHRTVQNNPQQRIQDVAEIISELRDPMKVDKIVEEDLEQQKEVKEENDEKEEAMESEESSQGISKAEKDRMAENEQKKKVEIAKIKVKLNVLKDDLDTAIRNKDFVQAQNLQLEIDELDEKVTGLNEELALLIVPRSTGKREFTKSRIQNAPEAVQDQDDEEEASEKPAAVLPSQAKPIDTPEVVHKCLVMLFELLQSPDINSLNATLQTILDEFVKEAVSSLDVDIKMAALKTIGAFCLRNLELAKQQLLLFSQIALVDLVNVRVTALEVIFDLLMWYGVQAFTDQDNTLESMFETTEDGPDLSNALMDVSQVNFRLSYFLCYFNRALES